MAIEAEFVQGPSCNLGVDLAALLRMMDWEGTRGVRRSWSEIESHEVGLGITIWLTRVQDHLRSLEGRDERLRAYRRILIVGIGSEIGTRKSVKDLSSLLRLLERLIHWLQANHPIVFEPIDTGVVREVVELWQSGRKGRDNIVRPDGSPPRSSSRAKGGPRGRGTRPLSDAAERPPPPTESPASSVPATERP